MTALRRCGFTFIELLVVVSIIAVLAGLLLGALGMMRRSQHRALTLDLMNHVTGAMATYLARWPLLGDKPDSADFVADPWRFMARRFIDDKRQPLLDLKARNLALALDPESERVEAIADGSRTAADAAYGPADRFTATHIVDDFANGEVLHWTVVNRQLAGTSRFFTAEIALRSRCGTPDPADDLVYRFAGGTAPGSTDGRWVLSP